MKEEEYEYVVVKKHSEDVVDLQEALNRNGKGKRLWYVMDMEDAYILIFEL